MNKDKLSDYFFSQLGWGHGFQSQIVYNFLCEIADKSKGGIVLDAGSGHQRYKPFFEDCLYIAQEHPQAGKVNKGINNYDILCDVRTIPIKNDTVDAVLSTSSFEHFEFPQEFVNESYRVLKPGGSLWINVPFTHPEHEIPYHFQHPTRYGLMRHFRHAGFSNYWVRPTSSSTSSGIFAFKCGMQEDFNRISPSSEKYIYAKMLLFFTEKFCQIVERIFDKGPFEDTMFPIGWVACATKKGKLGFEKKQYKNAIDFIKHNTLS